MALNDAVRRWLLGASLSHSRPRTTNDVEMIIVAWRRRLTLSALIATAACVAPSICSASTGVTFTEFPIPAASNGAVAEPTAITTGPDSNLWFTDPNKRGIGRITTNGAITEFPIPPASNGAVAEPTAITTGPDSNLWFTDPNERGIGRITTNGANTPGPPPVLSKLRISPRRFAMLGHLHDGRCVTGRRTGHDRRPCRRAIALRVSYELSRAASVRFKVERVRAGRRVGRRCVAVTALDRRHKRCNRLLPAGGVTLGGMPGVNEFVIRRRIGGHELSPSRFFLLATPIVDGKSGKPKRVSFQITL